MSLRSSLEQRTSWRSYELSEQKVLVSIAVDTCDFMVLFEFCDRNALLSQLRVIVSWRFHASFSLSFVRRQQSLLFPACCAAVLCTSAVAMTAVVRLIPHSSLRLFCIILSSVCCGTVLRACLRSLKWRCWQMICCLDSVTSDTYSVRCVCAGCLRFQLCMSGRLH